MMLSFQTWILFTALSVNSDVVLLDFHAPYCGPCRAMDSTVERMAKQGFPVRKIDVTRSRDIAQRFQVRSVPCFVLVAGGQERGRIVGSTSYDNLVGLFRSAGYAPGGGTAPANSGRPTVFANTTPPPAQNNNTYGATGFQRAGSAAPRQQLVALDPNALTPQQKALLATVRLHVRDSRATNVGTGTIIDTHGPEALVITCGHIFHESAGHGQITADLFHPQHRGTVSGQLLMFDEKRDVALVSIRTNAPIQPVKIGTKRQQMYPGLGVFSVGCDGGADPSLRPSHITSLNKYHGPANIQVAGEPVQGRSGGGLFATDGTLIGICNAADPQDREGFYASLPVIHWQLNQVGMGRLYESTSAVQNLAQQNTPRQPMNPVAQTGMQRSGNLQGLLQMIRNTPNGSSVSVTVQSNASGQSYQHTVQLDSRSRQMLERVVAQESLEPIRNLAQQQDFVQPPARNADGYTIRAQSQR